MDLTLAARDSVKARRRRREDQSVAGKLEALTELRVGIGADVQRECPRLYHPPHLPVVQHERFASELERYALHLTGIASHPPKRLERSHRLSDACNVVPAVNPHDLAAGPVAGF